MFGVASVSFRVAFSSFTLDGCCLENEAAGCVREARRNSLYSLPKLERPFPKCSSESPLGGIAYFRDIYFELPLVTFFPRGSEMKAESVFPT